MRISVTRRTGILCSLFTGLAILLILHGGSEAQEKPQSAFDVQAARHVKALRSRFHADREKAIDALSRHGSSVTALLEKATASQYDPERAGALRTLCKLDPGRAARLVLKEAMHSSLSVRLAALAAADSIGLDGARVLLSETAGSSPETRHTARRVIASACIKRVKKVLADVVSSPEGRGQFPGQYRALTCEGPVVEPALSAMVCDPLNNLAETAAAALGELGEKAAIPALKKAYVAGSGELKTVAAAALHLLGHDDPYREVIKLYENVPDERKEEALSDLTHFYHCAREYASAEQTMKIVIARYGDTAIRHIILACSLSMQNKLEEALAEFVKGVEKGYTDIEWVKIDGELANLREYKRFQDYVRTRFPEAIKEPPSPPGGEKE